MFWGGAGRKGGGERGSEERRGKSTSLFFPLHDVEKKKERFRLFPTFSLVLARAGGWRRTRRRPRWPRRRRVGARLRGEVGSSRRRRHRHRQRRRWLEKVRSGLLLLRRQRRLCSRSCCLALLLLLRVGIGRRRGRRRRGLHLGEESESSKHRRKKKERKTVSRSIDWLFFFSLLSLTTEAVCRRVEI